jgi:hypothetical protein
VALIHNTNWKNYGLKDLDPYNDYWIMPDTVTTNYYFVGTGYTHYINGALVGNVYAGGDTDGNGVLYPDKCSDGAHSHIEFKSWHEKGAYYEYHSGAGPDWYTYPFSPGDHLHNGID